jgi:hypothetical protein
MAGTTTAKTTTPRTRAPRKTAAKPTAPTTATVEEAPVAAAEETVETPEEAKAEGTTTDGRQKVRFKLGASVEETKSYAKFSLAKDADGNATGMVGTVYAPLGTEEVLIMLVGPAGK